MNYKVESLINEWNAVSKSERLHRLNSIDRQVTDILIHIEKKYRNLRTGEISFSPELSKLGLTW